MSISHFPLDKSAIWMLSFPHSHVHVYKACDRSTAKQYKGPFVLWRGRPTTPLFVGTSKEKQGNLYPNSFRHPYGTSSLPPFLHSYLSPKRRQKQRKTLTYRGDWPHPP